MISDGYKIYQNDHVVSYIISNHWGIHLKLILMSTVTEKLKMIKKKIIRKKKCIYYIIF